MTAEDQVTFEVVGHKLSDNLRIRITLEVDSVFLQLTFERSVILDNAIVDHGNRSVT